MRLQSSLGKSKEDSRHDFNMNGRFDYAEVIAINDAYGTADVRLIRNGDILAGGNKSEKFSCRLLKRFGGYDKETGHTWGETSPYTVGDLVLVGYVEGKATRPVILGAFDQTDDKNNVLTSTFPAVSEEVVKYLKVFPNQTYERLDCLGNYEKTDTSGSFEMATSKEINDNFGGTNFDNLAEKNKTSGKTIQPTSQDAKNWLKLFKTSGDKFVKFFLGKGGLSRFSRQLGGGKLTYAEVTAEGNFKLRKQQDSDAFASGSNFTEQNINNDGSFEIIRNNGGVITSVKVNSDGSMSTSVCGGKCVVSVSTSGSVSVNSESSVSVTSNGSASVNAKGSVSISSDSSVSVQGASSVSVSASSDITLSAGKINLN